MISLPYPRPARNKRLLRRLKRHHLPLLLLSASVCGALYLTRPYKDVLSRVSFATAYPALALLCATLMAGALNVLRLRTNPVSTDVRRDMGIWAGILGLVHTAVGQCVHLRGRPWLYYVYGPREHHSFFPLRHDLFGAANYAGAAAAVLLGLLLATSNDRSLRRLGAGRWKGVQRWSYAIFVLTAIHAFCYQASEKQKMSFVEVTAALFAFTMAIQIAGVLCRIRRSA